MNIKICRLCSKSGNRVVV